MSEQLTSSDIIKVLYQHPIESEIEIESYGGHVVMIISPPSRGPVAFDYIYQVDFNGIKCRAIEERI